MNNERAECLKCGLYANCNHPFMESAGPDGARVAVVLDAPGDAADRVGQPGIGEYGRIVDEMLAVAGLPRRHVWLTHAVRCHPSRKGGATVAQLKKCSGLLHDELAKLSRLETVITLGAGPLRSVVGRSAVANVRGTFVPVILSSGRTIHVLPTWSPAFILRNPRARPEMEADFARLKSKARPSPKPRDYRDLKDDAQWAEFMSVLDESKPTDMLAFDIETTGLNPWADDANVVCVSFSCSSMPGTAWAAPVVHASVDDEPDAWLSAQVQRILDVLDHPVRKATHNGKFDAKYLMVNLGAKVPRNWYWDSRMAAHLLDEERGQTRGNSLKALALVYTDLGDYSKKLRDEEDFSALDEAEWTSLRDYACADADATLRISMAQHQQVIDDGLMTTMMDVEWPKTMLCLSMEMAGIDVDWDALPTVKRGFAEAIAARLEAVRQYPEVVELERRMWYEANAKKLRDALKRAGLSDQPDSWTEEERGKADRVMSRSKEVRRESIEFNPASPQQKAALIYDVLGVRCVEFTDTGKPSTSAKALVQVMGTLNPYQREVIEAVEGYGRLVKVNSTYIEPMESHRGRDGRIRSDYQVSSTVTGRLSSRDPNMQNLPRGDEKQAERGYGAHTVKELMVAPPGYLFVSCDYAQIEMRLAAIFSQDAVMVDLINGGDIHKYLASKALGVPEEKITKDIRTMAKRVNFGALYGISVPGLVAQGVDEQMADAFLRTFWKEFRGFSAWADSIKTIARRQGYIVGAYGHKRRLPRINANSVADQAEAERQAVNFPIQNAAATVAAIAGYRLTRIYADSPFDAEVVMQVHDSLVSRVKEDHIEQVLALKKRVMTEEALPYWLRPGNDRYKLLVPIAADCNIGRDLWNTEERKW